MASIFTRIINDEIPGIFVWKDEHCVGLVDINPLEPGHVLVVPTAEVDHWLDLEPNVAAHLMQVAQAIAKAQRRAFKPRRIGLMIAGFEVPHTHIHVVPMNSMAALDFSGRDTQPVAGSLKACAEAIRAELRALGFDGVSH